MPCSRVDLARSTGCGAKGGRERVPAAPASPCGRGLRPGGLVVELHVLAVHLRLEAADVLRAGLHLLRRELEDAQVVEGDREEDLVEVRRQELERAALLL